MNLKLAAAIFVLVTTSAFAQGQMGGSAPKGPKPTKADAEKVVKVISGDKVKIALYCDMAKLNDQLAAADEKKDTKKIDELGKQLDEKGQKLGPEYMKLMDGLEQIDPDSAEGKALSAVLEQLDKLCAKN
jgi:hypothetical protein